MLERSEKYKQLEDRIWGNLQTSGLGPQIITSSPHSTDFSNYTRVELWTEFGQNVDTHQYMMWIQINIKHKDSPQSVTPKIYHQPVTPKIYRMTRDTQEQTRISKVIWNGVTEDDIKFIAAEESEGYRSGRRSLRPGDVPEFDRFYQELKTGNVSVEVSPKFAQYRVFATKKS